MIWKLIRRVVGEKAWDWGWGHYGMWRVRRDPRVKAAGIMNIKRQR